MYYSGTIEVQPPLSDAHAKLVEAFVNLEGSEDLRPTLEAIKSSEEADLPYHGGQMYISEDRSKIEACQGEQRHGLRLWLVHLVKHFFIPQSVWSDRHRCADRGLGCEFRRTHSSEPQAEGSRS